MNSKEPVMKRDSGIRETVSENAARKIYLKNDLLSATYRYTSILLSSGILYE